MDPTIRIKLTEQIINRRYMTKVESIYKEEIERWSEKQLMNYHPSVYETTISDISKNGNVYSVISWRNPSAD